MALLAKQILKFEVERVFDPQYSQSADSGDRNSASISVSFGSNLAIQAWENDRRRFEQLCMLEPGDIVSIEVAEFRDASYMNKNNERVPQVHVLGQIVDVEPSTFADEISKKLKNAGRDARTPTLRKPKAGSTTGNIPAPPSADQVADDLIGG